MPEFGQIYSQGVKYIKINRYNSGGLDMSGYLGQLQSLRIIYDDLGSIEYNINSIQEQFNYFIYGIYPINQPSESINYNRLDYFVSSSKNTSQTIPQNSSSVIILYDNNVNGNNLNYFDSSSGYYTFGSTPNTDMIISASVKTSPTGIGTFASSGTVRLMRAISGSFLNSIIIESVGYNAAASNVTTLINANYNRFIENDILYLEVTVPIANSGNPSISVSDVLLIVTQSLSSSYSDSLLTIFNPEFVDWDYNDYNPLYGNADISNKSNIYMDVDYGSGINVPLNFQLILSGTADKASIPDSNYSSKAWTNIRYNGIKSEAPYFNLNTFFGGYGTLPNTERNSTYFAYFNGVSGTEPIKISQTAYFIKYLIDINGNIVDPQPDSISLYNFNNSFEVDKNAIVRIIGNDPILTSNPNDNALTGNHRITAIGRLSPILITETGSGKFDYLTTMSFNTLDGSPIANSVQNLRATYKKSTGEEFISNTEWFSYNFDQDIYSPNWTKPSAVDYRLINYNTVNAGTRIKILLSFNLRKGTAPTSEGNSFQVRLLKNGEEWQVFNWVLVQDTYTNTGLSTNYQSYNFETNWFDLNENDYFTVQYRLDIPGTVHQLQIAGAGAGYNTYFNVIQETPSTTGFINGVTGVTSSYWSVGNYLTGSNVSVLTSSLDLYRLYTSQVIQATPSASSLFGFPNIVIPFNPILPGDWIRFQYDESRLHCITKVIEAPTNVSQSSSLFLTVVPPIATSSLLDHFILYRVVNDGTYVILDVEKPVSGNSFTGIIQPEYISEDVKNNYNDIIQNLTQKNLIQ